jgi:glycosyltransferase involved in cell wall biosynthesis
LKKTKKRVRFFIIGNGESKNAIMNEADRLGIDHCYFPKEKKRSDLTFCSWVRNVDVCIAGLDVIALCSYNEGTPVSLIEAQAGGRPIITTNVGGIENVVLKNETALMVSGHNYDDFSEAMLKLIEDDELRKKMGEKGWEFVKEKFHYTRLIKEMSTLYHELLDFTREKNYRNGNNY